MYHISLNIRSGPTSNPEHEHVPEEIGAVGRMRTSFGATWALRPSVNCLTVARVPSLLGLAVEGSDVYREELSMS